MALPKVAYYCAECDKDLYYASSGHFKRHQESHRLQAKVYHCDDCGKTFRYLSEAYFERHQERHKTHPREEKKTKVYHCDECGQSFRFKKVASFERHQERHGVKVPPQQPKRAYHCLVCKTDLFYTDCNSFRRHTSNHLSPIEFQCAHCPKLFSSTKHVSRHCKKVHENRKFYRVYYKGIVSANRYLYYSVITIANQSFVVGKCSTATSAARVYDEAVHVITGDRSTLNFPSEHIDCGCFEKQGAFEDIISLRDSNFIDQLISVDSCDEHGCVVTP